MPTSNLPPCDIHGTPAEIGFRNDCWECDMEHALAKDDGQIAAEACTAAVNASTSAALSLLQAQRRLGRSAA